MFAALPPERPDPAAVAALDRQLGVAFARAAEAVADTERVDAVASHGLTLVHYGERCDTLQIGSPYALRDALRASVVFDFRRADCAVGGHGAPLVPYVDALLFGGTDRAVVTLNLGGIANVTVLEPGAPPVAATGWDTGPGNMLLDAFVRRRTHGEATFDRDGAYASAGRADARVLGELLAREAFYLMQPPPKSTGRERFGVQLLDAHAELFDALSLQDGCATLCAFTAATVAESLATYGPQGARVIGSGGGMSNRALVSALGDRLAAHGMMLERSDAYGVHSDFKEAIAFAVLACETLRGRPANAPGATGAARPAVLGAIVPFELDVLLAKMRAECAANGAE